jgi:energy-coupling factor transporter ATP-binding protein EcfA2
MATAPPGVLQGLRIRQFAITNYRTFLDRTTIPLNDEVTVFHGDTGSGKSTALAAMDACFRLLAGLTLAGLPKTWDFSLGAEFGVLGRSEPLLDERDRPSGAGPTVFEATFASDPAWSLTLHIAVAGRVARVTSERAGLSDLQVGEVLTKGLFPFGASSRPFAVLDARRRPRWLSPLATGSRLAPSLASELYALSTSKIAQDRERWRSFTRVLASFPTLHGATITIEAGEPPELVIEHAGRIVLGIDELSSGEQQLAALTAGVLLAKAPIVAIEEPEMGLDSATQDLWLEVCRNQQRDGYVSQLIFESHAVTFDSDTVVRFRRDVDGWTRVEAGPASPSDSLSEQARNDGAKEVFVTPQGYTKLPKSMRQELGLSEKGAHVWFLRGPEAWQAWPESKLEEMLAEKPK